MIKDEIHFVDFVRNVEQAQVSIFINSIQTASGGREYTIEFKSVNGFVNADNTLIYNSKSTDTGVLQQGGLIDKIKIGLLPFYIKSDMLDQIQVEIKGLDFENDKVNTEIDDWNSWVFEIGIDGNANFEELSQNYNVGYEFQAERVTEEVKFELNMSSNENVNEYEIDDSTAVFKSSRSRISSFFALTVSDHFSLGARSEYQSSSYSNLKRQFSFEPGIEYNFIPYSEATKKQIRTNLFIGYEDNTYDEITIYDKKTEGLFYTRFNISTRFRQDWGDLNFSVYWKNFLENTAKRRINVNMNGFIRLFEGLRLRGSMGFSKISDQLYLPKGDVSKEEQLLQIRQLRTDYSYYFYGGISYSFGSIFSNVVNPRFGF